MKLPSPDQVLGNKNTLPSPSDVLGTVKKKVASKPRSQEELWGSDSQPQDLYTSLVTGAQEPQQESDGLGGPPSPPIKKKPSVLFPETPMGRPAASVMYEAKQPTLVESTPFEAKPKKYYRIVSDEKKAVEQQISDLEQRNARLGRTPESLTTEGTYQALQKQKAQLDQEFEPVQTAIKQIKKDTSLFGRMAEPISMGVTGGRYSFIDTETIKLNNEVEDKLIDKFDSVPEETKVKWYKGGLPREEKEQLINSAKTEVITEKYNLLKQDADNYIKNIKDNPNISDEEKLNFQKDFKERQDDFNSQLAIDYSGKLLKNNFKRTKSEEDMNEAILSKYQGFIPESLDILSTLAEGAGQVIAKSATAIPSLILMGAEQFNQLTGISRPEDYTSIEATMDLINDVTNFNFLPSSQTKKGKIYTKEGDPNFSYYSVGKTLANTLPFTFKIMNDVKKGRIEGTPQSMISQLINPKYNKAFADKLRVAESAYKITIGDNYREAKDLGMDDSKAFIYANTMSLAEGLSENIMPDFKYFDSVAGASIKNVFKGNLKQAVTKQAAKTVTKEFFKDVASEIGEEEFTAAVNDGLKYSLLLNHKNSEFFNLNKQKELVATTVIMSGTLGSVFANKKFKENKTDLYNTIHNNIYELQNSFLDEINSPLNDQKAKESLITAYKFANDVSAAISNAPENVTADQIDLLVQKKNLEEKKKNIDTAFHPDINEEIAGIDAKIRELAKMPSAVEEVEVVKPTEEQILKDISEGNLTTFTYKDKSEVPDAFKDKISSEGEVNGEKFVRVTVAKSLADYELSKAEKTAVEEVTPAVEQVTPAEVKPSGQKVTDIINRPATLESQAGVKLETPIEGDVYQEGQRVIFEDKNKKTYDLGNIDEVSDKTVEELGIKPQEEMVSLTPEGKIKVGGNEWNMQSELPNYGIEYDQDGNVKAVSLKDDAGKTVMYEGQVAEDAAYQVLLKQTETPEQRQAINEILENDEELNRQLREVEEATQAAAAEVTEPGAPKTKAEQYSEELDKTKESDPEAYWSVSPVSAEDAAKGTIIDTPDGAAIVKPDGDIAGLFKKVTSKAKGVAQDLLKRAIAAGGKKLDNYDTYLTPQYIKAGFRVVSRTPFNEKYAPPGWNKEKHGTPDVVAMIYDPEGKLDIEEKTFNDPDTGYDEAIAYRDSLLEPSIDMELEGLAKLFDESDKGFRMSQVDNAKEALKGILPGVEFIVHETNEAYNKATDGGNSGGTYIYRPAREGVPASRVIHINKKNANGRTVAHEVFHAVILDKIKGDKKVQEITARMVDAVYKTASPELRAELDAFAARYSDKTIRDEERLAELLGIIADGYPKMSQINKGIVKRWLEALAKMFGRKPFTDNEVIDLLNTLAGKVSTGEVISEEDVSILGYGSVKISKDIKRESKFIDSLVFDRFPTNKNTKVIENFDLSTIDGQVAASTLSDKLTAGELKKYKLVDGKKVLESVYTFFGGIGYPEVTGRVWAASEESGVNRIIDDMKVSSDGYRYLIPAVMSNVSHMSNKNMTSITMEVFKEAINNKELNRDVFKKLILNSFDKGSPKKFKDGAIKAISGNISAIKMADNLRDYVLSSGMTFQSRRDLLEKMVGNSEVGNPKFSTVGTFLSLATSLADPIAKEVDLHQVPVIIRTKGNLKAVKTKKDDKFYHESYGYHIESDQKVEVLHLDGVYNLTDIIPEFVNLKGETVSTANELKEKGAKGWDIKNILTNLGRTHGMSKYSAKIVSKKQQVEEDKTIKRSQLQDEGVTIEAKGNTLYTVNDNGKTVGSMELTSNKVLGKGYLSVNLSKLNEKYIGKGIGLDLYRTVSNKLKDKGIVLTSSVFRNDKSDRVWKSLEKSGEAVKIYSDIRLKDSVYALVNPEVRRSQKVEWEESRIGKGDKAITDRQPVLQNAAERYANKEIGYEEYLKIKDVTSPIKPITDFIEPAKEEDIRFAVGINAEGKTNLKFDKGTLLGLRLDINAYINKNIWAITIHAPGKGKVLSYNNVARLKNVTFGSNAKDALNIARHKINKATIARMHGEWIPIDGNTSEEKGKSAMKFVESIVNNPEWSQVGMNPFRHSWFYDRADGKPVLAADELIQIGGLVYAKNVVKTTPYDKAFEFIDQEGDIMRFQQANNIDEMVRIAKEAKYSDAAISSFLKAKGFSDAQIANAMSRPTITEDEAYDKFNAEFKKSKEEITNKKTVKEYIKQKYQNIIKNWSNRQVEAQSLLSKTGMVNTLNLSINSHGYSGKAKRLFQKSYDKIYKGLSTEKRDTLDKVIQAKRFIAIDNNRADRGLDPVKHPNYLNKQESQMYLDKLKKEIGDKAFNDITARADEYFRTYKKLLKDVYENGLISKESYDSMSDVDYQPRVFLQFVTDFEGDLKTAKNSVDSTSLSSDQIKSMKDGDVNSLVTNSEWLLSNSLVARTNAMAKNNINRRFMTDEFPKAKERFDKLDPKNLKGDDVRFYKYFKELQSKVIDNPIVGYTKEGNPKYKYDDIDNPTNFTKAYYYIDGVQHQFFLEDGLHKSWMDNVDGFLSRDIKEFVSYGSGSALVKAIATGNNPAFPIVNTPRDLMFTAAFSEEYSNFIPASLVQISADVIRSIREIGKKESDLLNKYYEYGGAMDFLSSQGRLKKDSLLGSFTNKMIPANVRDNTKGFFNTITLKKISEYSELMFRLGIFQRSINNSLKELGIRSMSEITDKQQADDIYNSAVASARGILDFNKGGVAAKDLESIIPYINVAFQGGSVALNAFKKNPVATTSRIFQIATIASTIPAGLSLFLIAASKGDDDEDKTAHEIYLDAMAGVSKYQKSKYMNIVTGAKNEDGQYRVIKIAKAQELSPIISVTDDITENMIRQVAGKEPKSNETIVKNAMFSLKNNVLPFDVTSPSGTIVRNPLVKAILTYQTGYDFFRDQPLAMGLEAKPAPYEGLDMKSVEGFYKDLGPKYGFSPVRSKAFVESLITTPDTNPFVGIMYAGAEAMSSNKDAKNVGENLVKNIYKSTGKRIVSYTSDFNRNLEAKQKLEKQIDEIKLKDAILKSEIKLASDRFIAKDITKEQLMDEFKNLDPFDKKRALMKIRDKKMMKDVESNIIDIKYEKSAKVKALMIQNYYGNILDKSDDSKEVIIQMKKAGNILTPEVIYELKNAQ